MKNIFIIRHGQSEANANVKGLLSKDKEYVIDSKFDLTDLGKEQVSETAKKIASIIKESKCGNSFSLYWSPYTRTRTTARILMAESVMRNGLAVFKQIEDPRLVEQDFGDFDYQYRSQWEEISPHSFKINQAKFYDPTGRFFARLENGENLLDVYNRASLFVTTRLERELVSVYPENHIIVTHGNTMRILRMFMTNLSIESFTEMEVPKNAGGYYLRYNEIDGRYYFIGKI